MYEFIRPLHSAEEYESTEALKLRLLQSRAAQANDDIAAGKLLDGEAFFSELDSCQHD
ncbi:hypothetical protein [Pleionea sp. CnH1-48]|uniref:hypothetical protein n=1 Tax=Pleionea sp. CnH1-48 TaxID=2954494 RepID=UPI0020983F6E|nr:hypothetical protein [Pleionea sp. CnH1-48]MCO7227576.1 hypothetical protein [Pleionea sp. CnH1-48]